MPSSTADRLRANLYRVLATVAPREVGVAFSGGVDSTLLAKACADLGKRVTLCTIGFASRRDIAIAQRIAAGMALPLCHNEVPLDALEASVTRVASLIDVTRLARLENSVGFYHVFELAAARQLQTVLSANGLDELFCGYDAFRRRFLSGTRAVTNLMQRLVATARADKAEVDKLAATFGLTYRCPFLSPVFEQFATTIPIPLKITGADDTLRKHVLRAVARTIGVPDAAAYRPKKAFQYSSGVHRALRRLARLRGYTRSRAVQTGYRSALDAYLAHLTGRTA